MEKLIYQNILDIYAINQEEKIAFKLISKSGHFTILYHCLKNKSSFLLKLFKIDLNLLYKYCSDKKIIISHKKVLKNYKKYMFIRNPYIRVFSSYKHLQEHYPLEPLFSMPFNKFVKKHLIKLEKYNHHFMSFKRIINHKQVLEYTKLLYFEKFNKHIKDILKEKKIENFNKSNSKEIYKRYYNTKTKNIIQKIYKDDIKIFGYNFDGYVEKELPFARELKNS